MTLTEYDRGSIDDGSKGWSPSIRKKVRECPREAEHFYGPSGYVRWHSWAERMSKTYKQLRCECGLWLLLKPKPPRKPRTPKP